MNKSCPDTMKGSVMYARLSGGDILLMAGDDSGTSCEMGTGKIYLALGGSDEEKLRRIFEALSAGGKADVGRHLR